MKKYIFLVGSLALCMTSCMRSLNPIYSYDDLYIDDEIIGSWVFQKPDSMEISEIPYEISIGRACYPIYSEMVGENNNIATYGISSSEDDIPLVREGMNLRELDSLDYYILSYESKNECDSIVKEYFILGLTQINDLIYIDIMQKDDITLHNNLTGFNIPAHYFGTMDVTEKSLSLKMLNVKYFYTLLTDRKVRLKNQVMESEGYNGENEIILTASTDEMRSFFGKYEKTEELWETSISYNRQ